MILVADPPRYKNLARLVSAHACWWIIEIGVFYGLHATQMINAAKELYSPDDIYYLGFDLFEEMDQATFDKEFSKNPPTMEAAGEYLQQTGANISLIKGDTKETLPKFIPHVAGVSLIFIDGGHSEETIASDWRNVETALQPDTIVVFDDYYIDPPSQMDGLGCNSLIDNLDRARYEVEFLEPVDSFQKPWGTLKIQMVKVSLKG